MFFIFHVTLQDQEIKELNDLQLGTPQGKSLSFQIWCAGHIYGSENLVLHLSRDLARPRGQRVMRL